MIGVVVASVLVAVGGVAFLAAEDITSHPLAQLGVAGIFAAAAAVLFRRMQESYDNERKHLIEAREQERQRADRLEAELRDRNALDRDRTIPALVESNRMTQELVQLVKELRR